MVATLKCISQWCNSEECTRNFGKSTLYHWNSSCCCKLPDPSVSGSNEMEKTSLDISCGTGFGPRMHTLQMVISKDELRSCFLVKMTLWKFRKKNWCQEPKTNLNPKLKLHYCNCLLASTLNKEIFKHPSMVRMKHVVCCLFWSFSMLVSLTLWSLETRVSSSSAAISLCIDTVRANKGSNRLHEETCAHRRRSPPTRLTGCRFFFLEDRHKDERSGYILPLCLFQGASRQRVHLHVAWHQLLWNTKANIIS